MTRKPTSNLHDYTNIMNYIMITVESQTIASSDAAFSDMKGEIIKSFPDQVAEQFRIASQIAANAGINLDELDDVDIEDFMP